MLLRETRFGHQALIGILRGVRANQILSIAESLTNSAVRIIVSPNNDVHLVAFRALAVQQCWKNLDAR